MRLVKKTLALCALIVPIAAHAQWLTSFGVGMLSIFRYLVPTLIGIALIVFMWGLIIFMTHGGDERAHEEGRQRIVWGIIILFVVVSVWGIVNLLQRIVGVRGEGYVRAPYVDYTHEAGLAPSAPPPSSAPPPGPTCDNIPGNSIPECGS